MTPADYEGLAKRLDEARGHTPGPWTVYHKGDCIQIDFADHYGVRPCIVMWSGFDSNDLKPKQNLTNARLIALAPELAAAHLALVQREQEARGYMQHKGSCEFTSYTFTTHSDKPDKRFNNDTGAELRCTCGLDAFLQGEPK